MNDQSEQQEGSEPAEIQLDEEAFTEFERQLADERAELERLHIEVVRLSEELASAQQRAIAEPVGNGIDGNGSESVTVGEGPTSIETNGSDPMGDATAVVVLEDTSIPIELPPKSTHPLYRRIWGRDTEDSQPGEHWIHRKIGS